MKINIFYKTKVNSYIRKDDLFKKVILKTLKKHAKKNQDVNLVFVDGKEIKRINKTFLKHTYQTDVIAFEYNDKKNDSFGDIFVCYDVAKKQAKEYKHSILIEMLFLSCHGALHLAGYKDKTAIERKKMDNKTIKILQELKCLT